MIPSPPPPRPFRKGPARLPRPVRLAVVSLLAVFIAGGLVIARHLRASAAAGPAAPVASAGVTRPDVSGLLSIPPFSLVDQDGRAFSRDDLLGHVSVLDVFFTSCPLVCPGMTEKMHALAEALADTPTRFVSVSIDPRHDTPAALREYRRVHDVAGDAADRWSHLTSADGSDAYVGPLVRDGLRCAVDPDPNLTIKAPDGTDMPNILHPAWFFLLDARDGRSVRVVGLYASGSDEEMNRLLRDARDLAGASRAP